MAIVVTEYRADVKQYIKALDDVTKRLDALEDQEKDVEKQSGKTFKEGTKDAQKFDSQLGKVQQRIGKQIAQWASFAAAVGLLKNAVDTVTQYQQAVAELGAITGKSGDDLKAFDRAVIRVSQNTGKGAVEIANAFKLVGSAQPELLDSASALGAVTEQAVILAKAGGLTVPQAADALTKSMNQFGVSALDAAKFTDILATSQQKGTANIALLSESFVNAGANAAAAGLTFEETNAALQALAKGGLVGAQAGTGLAGVLGRLRKAGLGFVDGQFDMATAIAETEERINAIQDPIERTTFIQNTFGVENEKTIQTLIAQQDVLKTLSGGLEQHGNALEQANQVSATFNGRVEEAKAGYDRFIISLVEGDGAIARTINGYLELQAKFEDFKASLFGGEEINFGLISSTKELKTELGLLLKDYKEGNIDLDTYTESVRKLHEASAVARVELKKQGDEEESNLEVKKRTVEVINDEISKLDELLKKQSDRAGAMAIQERIEELKKERSAILGLSEKQAKAARDRKKENIESIQDAKSYRDAWKEAIDEVIEAWDKSVNAVAMGSDQVVKLQRKSIQDINAEIIQESEDTLQALIDSIGTTAFAFNEIVGISGNIATASNNKAMKEIDERERTATQAAREELDRLERVGKLTEEQAIRKQQLEAQLRAQEIEFDNQRKEEARQNAAIQKSVALFEIGINTAASIAKTAAELGFPAAIPFIALAAASGAAQAAVVATSPLPGFAEGVIGLQGPGTETSDSIPAMLSKGESVMTAKETRENREELEAIRKGNLPQLVMRKYVLPQIMEMKKAEAQGQAALIAQNIANSITGGDLSGKRFSKEMAFSRRHDAELTERLIDALAKSKNTYRA